MDVFKVLSTLAVFLFGTVWAFRNLRAIFEKVGDVTGIETQRKTIETTTESGTKLTITTNTTNTESQ